MADSSHPSRHGSGLSRRLHAITTVVAPPGGGHRTLSTLLPCGFTPTDDFVLQRVLNRDGMNMFSQLSISVCFTLRVTCLGSVPYMLPKDSLQSIEHAFQVLWSNIISRNRSGAAKPRSGLNGLRFLAAILACRWWVIVSLCMAYLLLCVVIFWALATRFCTRIFSRYLCFSNIRVFAFLIRLSSLFYA
jgi:hypothetical protein